MAYDARKKEILAQLDAKNYDERTKAEILRALDTYFAQREGYLENLLETLEVSDEPRHARWLEIAKQAHGAACELYKASETGKIFLAGFGCEESVFFFELMNSQVPVRRDDMLAMTKRLGVAEREFEEKWRTIVDADKSIEERMRTIATEYDEILRQAASKAADAERSSKEEIAKAVQKGVKILLALVDFGVVERILKSAVDALIRAIDESKARRLEIHALISREKGVFSTFLEGREIVKRFLENTSYPRIKDAYDAAEDAAEALAGRMPLPGQKDDANAYCGAIKYELQKVFAKAEDAYKAFARKHEYLFFGPLGGSYFQELMEDDSWKQFSSNWRDRREDIDDILRESYFKADSGSALDVSLDGLSPENKKVLADAIQDDLQELLRRWNDFKDVCKNPEWALESREELRRILDAMR